jgi:Holliday junction resolvase
LVCDEQGNFYFVELKTTKGNSVRLSPHQISWLTQHQHAPTYIIVQNKNADVFVFTGGQSIELAERGLLLESAHHFPAPVNWVDFFSLTFPI